MKIKIISHIHILFILFHVTKIKGSETKWIESLKESIITDGHIYQVVIMMDKSIENSAVYNPIFKEILKELSSSIPVNKIILPHYDKPTKSDFIIYNPRISLFVLMSTDSNSEITASFEFLTQLSESRRRPKCLLLLAKRLPDYRKFFEKLWNEQFLDVTVIEIGKYEASLNNSREDSKVIQYNPFLDLITTASASKETIWFPKKLKSLHGYPLVVSFIHSPPDVFVPENKSEKMFGFAIKKIESLKEIINFSIVESTTRSWGRIQCSKENSSGVLKGLFTNQIQIITKEVGIESCIPSNSEISKGLRKLQFGLIVPLISKNAKSLTFKLQVINLAMIMLLPIVIWIVSRLMHFNKNKWKIDYLLRINLGTVVPEEPERTPERLMFLTFLLVCIMFSSQIYTSMTSAQLQTKTEFKYETLEDVVSSNLQIFITQYGLLTLKNTIHPLVRRIVRKANFMVMGYEECLDRSLKSKNVSCIMEIPRANLILSSRRDECGHLPVKIFTKNFESTTCKTSLGAGVPYAKRFDQVLQRIIESGLSKKWMEPYSTKSSMQPVETCSSRELEVVLTIHQLIFVAVTGFLCSFCVFLSELFIYRFKNWRKLRHKLQNIKYRHLYYIIRRKLKSLLRT